MANLVDARTWVVDNLVVNSALILAPGSTSSGSITFTTETITTLTVTGNTTVGAKIIQGAGAVAFRNAADTQDNLTISAGGDVTVRSVLSVGQVLQLTSAVSKIVPGVTSLSLRNQADTADNLLIADAGNATFRTSVTLGAELFFSVAAARIVGGGTSLSLRNTGNTLDNVLVLENGNTTIRGNLVVSGVGPHAIGTTVGTNIGLREALAATASGAVASLQEISGTLTAAANNDKLAGLDMDLVTSDIVVASGTFTGLDFAQINLQGNGVSKTGTGTVLNA